MLGMMTKGNILSHSETVTNKMIAVESITEAVEAVLSYTKDAEELLKRNKVHPDVIFKYLAKERVVMPPNSKKNQVKKRTLEFWSTGKLLNSQNPTLGLPPQDWDPQHFWEDVCLRLFSSADGQQMEEFHGSELTSLRLLALSRDERLLLSPNLDPPGLKALSSPTAWCW